MANYENQKRIEIKNFNNIVHKEKTTEPFLQPINWCYYEEALNTLSGNAFKLWFYLLRWVGQGYYDCSPVKLQKTLNVGSKNTIYSMRDELIRNNYLVSISDNIYYFYPCGHADLIYQKLNRGTPQLLNY